MIRLILSRIGEGEMSHRFVERGPVPEVSREHSRLRRLRMRSCKYRPAESSVFLETGSVELFDVHRALHVAELPHVVVSIFLQSTTPETNPMRPA